MAHEIDETTGAAAMAYMGAKPWHGLGAQMPENASIEDWKIAAGINWTAERSVVQYVTDANADGDGILSGYDGRNVLYRSDTKAPLSVVSSDYQIVQPGTALEFFRDLTANSGFQIETAGALKEGRRVWALARVGENAKILDDEVAPYLMLATSYDGSMATIAQFTSIRVVCNNTLQASLQAANSQNKIAIPHSAVFDIKRTQLALRIATTSWDEFIIKATTLAKTHITQDEASAYLCQVLAGNERSDDQIIKSKGYQRIMGLFAGGQYGGEQDAVQNSLWGVLNATTQYIDHEVGRMQNNRLDSAWFGIGAALKNKAFEIAQKVAA